MSIYKNTDYLQHNETWHVEDSAWKADQIVKLIDRNGIQARHICEVGCGAGEILVQLSKKLPDQVQYTGYDISPQLEPMWRERQCEQITFRNQDILTSDDFYDMLMFIDVIEHIEDYIGFVHKIKEKGHYKIFNFPLEIFAVKALLGHKFLETRKKYGHIHYFNKDICLSLLKELNFNIMDYFYAPGAIDLAETSKSASRSSRALKIPRILLSKISVDFTAKLLGGYSLFVLAE